MSETTPVVLEQLSLREIGRLAEKELGYVVLAYQDTRVDKSRPIMSRAEELYEFGMDVIRDGPSLRKFASQRPIRLLRHATYELFINDRKYILKYHGQNHTFHPTRNDWDEELFGKENGATSGLANMSKLEMLRRINRGLKMP